MDAITLGEEAMENLKKEFTATDDEGNPENIPAKTSELSFLSEHKFKKSETVWTFLKNSTSP